MNIRKNDVKKMILILFNVNFLLLPDLKLSESF